MSEEHVDEMGPIDYVVLEWAGDQPVTGEVAPLLVDLVERGIIRMLDIAFVLKEEDGTVTTLDFAELAQATDGLLAFAGDVSGLLDQSDLEDAAAALDPGTVAGVLVWENLWAAPIARAMRRSGGQLAATGRIPVQAMLAARDAAEGGPKARILGT